MNRLDIKNVKAYLRIDFDDDDFLLNGIMLAAEEYIKSAVGVYDSSNPKANMLYMAIVQDLYDNRALTVTEQQRKRMSYMFSAIILQLQLESQGGAG